MQHGKALPMPIFTVHHPGSSIRDSYCCGQMLTEIVEPRSTHRAAISLLAVDANDPTAARSFPFQLSNAVDKFSAKVCARIAYLGRTVLIAVRARAFMMEV
eukprot:scaffold26889_cov131-Skeletonema_dohrnii-CCMP3373.AAC.6